MRNGLQCLLQLARLGVSTCDIVCTCATVAWLLRPTTHRWTPYMAFRGNYSGNVGGKKREKMRVGLWTWHSSNNDSLGPATLIFPLINRWQENAKDANVGLRVPLKWSKHSGTMPRGTAGLVSECELGCRSQSLLFLPFPSSSTCLCGTGQGQHGCTWCFEFVTCNSSLQWCANSAVVNLVF